MTFSSDKQRRAAFAHMSRPQASSHGVPFQPQPNINPKRAMAEELAKRDDVVLLDYDNYEYAPNKDSVARWDTNELFNKSKSEKEVLLSNRVPVWLEPKDKFGHPAEMGTLVDFGYNRKNKMYYVKLARQEIPSANSGLTGSQTVTMYYDRSDKIPIYRLQRKQK